jgi:hypothetical protein
MTLALVPASSETFHLDGLLVEVPYARAGLRLKNLLSLTTRDKRRSVYRWHCRRFLVKNPHPTRDFQVIDSPTSGLGMKGRLHVK